MTSFSRKRRQKYIDEESYKNTLLRIDDQKTAYAAFLAKPEPHIRAHAQVLMDLGSDLWHAFQIRYTAGEKLEDLAASLSDLVEAFDRYVEKNREVPEDEYLPPFRLFDDIDTYVDFLNLISATILLHREDLLPKIFAWIQGGEFDGVDAVLEELLNFYFSDRPSPDDWYWDEPYQKLLDVIDAEQKDRPALMKQYLKCWYPKMKGKAFFWGAHEKIAPEYSPYFGYWAMCAGAFTYLLDIDDASYRDEEVYPKDMVDYARSLSRRSIKESNGIEILRVEGGQGCPREGTWFSPANNNSERYFKAGEVMPVFDRSQYGQTIWQWVPDA